MKNIFQLAKRNLLLFLRNKQVVFTSFFSTIILVVLYFLFIAKLYSQGFNEAAGLLLSEKQLNALIYLQMVMGVIVINSVSLSTGMFSFMAKDIESRKTNAFMLTRLKPYQLLISYLIAAIVISFALNLLVLIVSVVIIGAATSFWLGAGAFFAIVGVTFLAAIIGCAVMLLITSSVRSSTAIGVINGFIGTILGFLCGIYMPFENLGKGATYVGSFLPFTHLAIWLKQIALKDAFAQFGVPSQAADAMQYWFSAKNIGLCGADVPLWGMMILSAGVALICLIASIFVIRKFLNNTKSIKIRKTKQPHS